MDNRTLIVCLYPKDLNKAVFHENHKAPMLEEIAPRLADSTTYSKQDAKNGFLKIYLTTFYIHLGRYKFKCIPFDLGLLKDIFQMNIDQIVERCPGILCIHDDLYVYVQNESIVKTFSTWYRWALRARHARSSVSRSYFMAWFSVHMVWSPTKTMSQELQRCLLSDTQQ